MKNLLSEIIATYRKYGWKLERALLTSETRATIAEVEQSILSFVPIKEFPLDALWFARPSAKGSEAWELRLVAAAPYALFETFDETEDEALREERRREMESELLERAGAGGVPQIELDGDRNGDEDDEDD